MLFIPNAVRILARHRSKNPAAAPAPDCTTTSRPALVSFETSSGTSATRRSPGADSFGTLAIICACESKGRSRLNPVIFLAACHSLHLSRSRFLNFNGRRCPLAPDETPQANWGRFTSDNYRQYSASIGGWLPLEQKLSTSQDHRLRRRPTLSHSQLPEDGGCGCLS